MHAEGGRVSVIQIILVLFLVWQGQEAQSNVGDYLNKAYTPNQTGLANRLSNQIICHASRGGEIEQGF